MKYIMKVINDMIEGIKGIDNINKDNEVYNEGDKGDNHTSQRGCLMQVNQFQTSHSWYSAPSREWDNCAPGFRE